MKGKYGSPFQEWVSSEPWNRHRSIALTGIKGSSKAYLLSRLKERGKEPLLVVVSSLQKAESLAEDLRFFIPETGDEPLLFSPWETLPYDEIPPHPEIIRERVLCLFSLANEEKRMVIAPVQALMQKVLAPADLKGSIFSLHAGQDGIREDLIGFLQENDYAPVRVVEERGDFSLRGAIIDLYCPSYEEPLRLEFDGDRLASIRPFEPESQRSIPERGMETALLLPARDVSKDLFERPPASFFDYFSGEGLLFIDEMEEVNQEAASFSHSIEEHYKKALARKRTVLPPGLLYQSAEEMTQAFKGLKTAHLQEGPLAPVSNEESYAFETETNEDFRMEIRTLFATKEGSSEASPFSAFLKKIFDHQRKGEGRFFIVSHTSGQAERLGELLSHHQVAYRFEKGAGFRKVLEDSQEGITLMVGSLSSGFKNPGEGWTLLTEEEIFGERRRLRERKSRSYRTPGAASPLSYQELHENDFIVHVDYGVGLYRGLKHLRIDGVGNDYLSLEYLDGDKVYVPVDRFNLVQRYVGPDGGSAHLDKLGSQAWQKAKRRARALRV